MTDAKFYPIDPLAVPPAAVGLAVCAACSDLGTIGHGTSCSPMIICPECNGKSAQGAPIAPTVVADPGVSELDIALHEADKWETLYRNEHATCTRLLDTMTGYRKERDALQARLTGPVSIAMPELESEFATWWEDHGQYIRAGGGNYEKSFAYGAYRDALEMVAKMNTTAAPAEVQP